MLCSTDNPVQREEGKLQTSPYKYRGTKVLRVARPLDRRINPKEVIAHAFIHTCAELIFDVEIAPCTRPGLRR